MRVGFYVSPSLREAYGEILSLLNLNGEFYRSGVEYDALVVDGLPIPNLQTAPRVMVVYGPTQGAGSNNSRPVMFNLPESLGQRAAMWLLQGQNAECAETPALDDALAELKTMLSAHIPLVEIRPNPWNHPYWAVFSHDIDVLSVRELAVGRTLLGYFERSLVRNLKRTLTGHLAPVQYLHSATEAARALAARCGVGTDSWGRSMSTMLELEDREGVRSTSFFLPRRSVPGVHPHGGSAPANRSAHYDLREQAPLLNQMIKNGHEVGVHGIDSWVDAQSACAERKTLSRLVNLERIGVRMHWLYFDPKRSWQALDDGGYCYDSTFGFNEVIGFRAGTMLPYRPPGTIQLWELPLIIQDGALLGEEYQNIPVGAVRERCETILDHARRSGGVLSILWHNNSFVAPRYWTLGYEELVAGVKADAAKVTTASETLMWHERRRGTWIDSVELNKQECRITIRLGGAVPPSEMGLTVRLYIHHEMVADCSCPSRLQTEAIDILCCQPVITVDLKDGACPWPR